MLKKSPGWGIFYYVNKINYAINEIRNIKTIAEEKEELMLKAKAEAIKQLDEYYSSLSSSDFAPDILDLVIERIRDSKLMINKYEEVSKIVKLVSDTIEVIEKVKLSA